MIIGPGAEAELLDAQALHLDAGVDLVLASAPRPNDAAREVFETYERAGYVAQTAPTSIVDVEPLRVLRAANTPPTGSYMSGPRPSSGGLARRPSVTSSLRYRRATESCRRSVREFVPRRGDESFADRMTARDSLAEASAGDRPLLDRLRPI